jgi:hypothetical protein
MTKAIPQPLLSPQQVDLLVGEKTISDRYPWSTQDGELIESFLREVCKEVSRAVDLESRCEWNHYGSGYASFVEAWFYKQNADFEDDFPEEEDGGAYIGLTVLLSRLSPYFVFLQASKGWNKHSYRGSLPNFLGVDQLTSPHVARLADIVQPILEGKGLVRAFQSQLRDEIDTCVPTILKDAPFIQFDALFYWED